MKIRTYKGPSLEELYDTIHRELGPDAVVVQRGETSSRLGGLLGRRRFEVVAVVDDSTDLSHILGKTASAGEVRRLSRLVDDKWRTMEKSIESLRREIAGGRLSADVVGSPASAPRFTEGWDPAFVAGLREAAPRLFNGEPAEEPGDAVAALLNVEDEFLPGRTGEGPAVVVLTGPTGSGKTTTLAKLAARWGMEYGMNVGLVTTDTYRIAAVDQTKEYAALLGMELRVVFSAAQAAQALASMREKDVILVDTPGRNHRDDMGMSGLKGMLAAMPGTTIFTLVPATMGCANAREMLRNFKVLGPHYVVVTKTDEVRRATVLTSVACEMPKQAIAFFTNGQRVPQDIRVADRRVLAGMLLGERAACETATTVSRNDNER